MFVADGMVRMLRSRDPVGEVPRIYQRREGFAFDASDPGMRCYELTPSVGRTWCSTDIRGTGLRWSFTTVETGRPTSSRR